MARRAFDIVFGTVAALLATPVIIVLAIAMAVSLRTWPFFVQERIGQYGRMFKFPKIRTLPRSMSQYTSKHTFNLAQIPRLARFMRRTHLDELPQLYLVPIGTMSLVGPRPKMPDFVEPIEPAYGRMRIQIRQGCTGLWQVGEHSHLQVSESPAYDLYYLRHASPLMDLWILWRTVARFVGARGVRLDAVPTWARGTGFALASDADRVIDLSETDLPEFASAAGR